MKIFIQYIYDSTENNFESIRNSFTFIRHLFEVFIKALKLDLFSNFPNDLIELIAPSKSLFKAFQICLS